MISKHEIIEASKKVDAINLLEAEIRRANYLEQENAKLELELSELKAALLGWQDSIGK